MREPLATAPLDLALSSGRHSITKSYSGRNSELMSLVSASRWNNLLSNSTPRGMEPCRMMQVCKVERCTDTSHALHMTCYLIHVQNTLDIWFDPAWAEKAPQVTAEPLIIVAVELF